MIHMNAKVVGIGTSALVALIFALLIGLFNGWLVMATKLPSFIITLGTWLMAHGMAALITRGYPIVFDMADPFLVLADWLARRGVATLRYDDRGVGIRFACVQLLDDAISVVAPVADEYVLLVHLRRPSPFDEC